MTAEPGWAVVPDEGFLGFVGPLLRREDEGGAAYAIRTDARHRNLRDVVQGGLLLTLADRAMGSAVRAALGQGPVATVQLDVHFLAPTAVGALLVARAEVTRQTRAIVFVEGRLLADDRLVATAKGIWKRLRRPEAAPDGD